MNREKVYYFVIFLGGILIGVIGTNLLFKSQVPEVNQVRQGGYALINPLIECEVGFEVNDQARFTSLKEKLEEESEDLKRKANIDQVAIYVRDLNNGPSLDINGNVEFAPASLLKVPIMMSHLKKAEIDPKHLGKKVKVELAEDMNVWESIRPSIEIKNGNEYTTDQLIEAMIMHSDNNAMGALTSDISQDEYEKVYSDLGLDNPLDEKGSDILSVKDYATFFRVLYNASYLSKEYSEKALSILVETDFDKGISAGVPKEVKVANKFGERVLENEQQLHDCGIVYKEDTPYLICIMMRGENIEEMSKGISQISKTVFDELSK